MTKAIIPQPRPGIMEISPYVGGESKLAGVDRIIKLSSNEGALGASPRVRDALIASAGEAHRYPDGNATALREALGRTHGLDPARIVCGAGSDELIGLLCRAYAGPGDSIVQSAYGFLMYGIYARGVGAEPILAPESDLTADIDAMLAAVRDTTKLVFLANPNNPTGTCLPTSEVVRLREGLRDDIILVVDAAYAEYVERNDYDAGARLVDSHPNTVMLRTFSKIGLGGLRLGWSYGPAHIIDVLNRVRGPFNICGQALVAGEAALADPAFTDLSRAHNSLWREWTRAKLQAMGIRVGESSGNFVLATFDAEGPFTALAADAALRQQGIICRRVAGYGLPNCLRITIGRDDEMQAVVEALGAFMAGEGR
ncbi:histidinol-phosphate transaminase [Rhodospirillum rubrum]|uniref:Histidinol-phosphate aminotransferase n=1 Tax=Rhodospirillum rubrum (strain ATCC 11170 / ATH 1.1.1 / DSM 467 / LMG 4362 / NCIMB 8255 / S1) TaxID=269796 RepID=HIS8_RHORT|nr:histidinol-phosphate transaminase [Rhodospirillum rubrum]Q2RP86.1 RecName: Full=Histidinol-phosphate aminotransferase; AltName: Full=Imidazole acetol-phosphate transaminase [Rhodospirillum rubrum ATCC 11170]ABC24059.1 histidinol phosphate aminotransferase [Rhodospirillum rubrum ATCC 11170]AEO49805.1 histidinol-phosphate aminotransferase [Rhodospirillum rubrum F11]MBK5955744.1 histidinol-phosphate transaminase [Rhodospirillum rubrum]QXG80002.1 histidinol-phosphate transaminase [Rhodospirillu